MGPKKQGASHGRQVIWCQEWARCTSYLRAPEFLLWARSGNDSICRNLCQPIRGEPKHIRLDELSYEICKVLGHDVELLRKTGIRVVIAGVLKSG